MSPKSFCNLFSTFHVKSKLNMVYEHLKTKIFSRDTNILPQMHWTSNIFGHSATTIGGFWVSLNYPILNFKKTVCPKNVWMQHWNSITILKIHGDDCCCNINGISKNKAVYLLKKCWFEWHVRHYKTLHIYILYLSINLSICIYIYIYILSVYLFIFIHIWRYI